MARKEAGASAAEATAQRIRDLNERIIESSRTAGSASLDAYERLLKNFAAFQESAGARGAEWVTSFAKAQANFTRELAKAYPAAARRFTERVSGATGSAARQARRVPGVAEAEGEVRGAGASADDLPIARYDSLNASEVNSRLSRLDEVELGQIDAYERKHRNRKTVRDKIASLRG